MKEPNYVMKLMATCGTNERIANYTTKQDQVNLEGGKVSESFCCPEVFNNHFKFYHFMGDHNAKRHAPICLEHVWTTKYRSHMPFSFLLATIEMNINPAEAYFVRHKASRSQLEFWKLIIKDLIHNKYLIEE